MRRRRLITLFIALAVLAGAFASVLPASAASTPFGTGLGAKRAEFEARYGKPVDSRGAGDFALGTEYRVASFAAVYVFWHKDVAAHIVLVAQDGWESKEAVAIAKRFLPADASFATSGTGANKRGQAWAFANGHSQALGKRLAASTYRKYGVGGAQGDLRLALMPDRAGKQIVLIDIAIGQGQKFTPPASAPKQSVPGHIV